jgi:hypothetical protein
MPLAVGVVAAQGTMARIGGAAACARPLRRHPDDEVHMGSVIKKRRKRMAKKKHRKLLRKTRHQRRNKK